MTTRRAGTRPWSSSAASRTARRTAPRTTSLHLRLRRREVICGFEGRNLPELLLTTDHVVFEERAVHVGERLYSEKLPRLYRTSFDEQMVAFQYLKRHGDKDYSAVDCLSFVVMEKLGIHEALAVDEDFTHRFIARPDPRPR